MIDGARGTRGALAVVVIGLAAAACRAEGDAPPPPRADAAGTCVSDSVARLEGPTVTEASQQAIYRAVLDSVRNFYGKQALFLDPRVETVGQGKDSTARHPPALVDLFMASGRFADVCEPDDASRCDVDSVGVSVRFSNLLRHTATDAIVVDVTEQIVRPIRDSSDWYFWAGWARYWMRLDGRCWTIRGTELKGLV